MASEALEHLHLVQLDLLQRSRHLAQRARVQIASSEETIKRSRELLSENRNTRQLMQSCAVHPLFLGVPPTSTPPQSTNPSTPQPTPECISGQHLAGITLSLDNRHFLDCTIENCVLEYSGAPVILERTSFTGCSFRLGGAAAMTASVLECFSMLGTGTPAFPQAGSDPERKPVIN